MFPSYTFNTFSIVLEKLYHYFLCEMEKSLWKLGPYSMSRDSVQSLLPQKEGEKQVSFCS